LSTADALTCALLTLTLYGNPQGKSAQQLDSVPVGTYLMSVVPLIRTGNSPTVVDDQGKFDVTGDAVLIYPWDPEQPRPGDSNVSYDLRIGREYRDHRGGSKTELAEGDVIELLPGTAVLVETLEYVHLPQTRFGYVVPRVSMLQDAISNTLSKVDPGYPGRLIVTVFNLGRKVVPLKYGAPFCSLVIHTVGDGADLYGHGAKAIRGERMKGEFRKLLDRVEANAGALSLMSLVTNVILALLTFVLTYLLLAPMLHRVASPK